MESDSEDDWRDASAREIALDRKNRGNPYAHVDGDGEKSAIAAADRTERAVQPPVLVEGRRSNTRQQRHAFESIRRQAQLLQRQLWAKKHELWTTQCNDPIEVLDPSTALAMIGYEVRTKPSLGQTQIDGDWVEVAGYVDTEQRLVEVSSSVRADVRRFTMAHELGHAKLHDQVLMHRDRALDGSASGRPRDRTELEADKFATYFLMPEKQVRLEFYARFLTYQFEKTDQNLFGLLGGRAVDAKRRQPSRRDLARHLAACSRFNGASFISISKRFGVSVETMAIRLEELLLVPGQLN